MLFFISQIVCPDTCTGCSDTKKNMDTTRMSQFKNNIPKAYPQITYWMNNICIVGGNYSEIARQKKPLLHLIMPNNQEIHGDQED